jgi:hypothetical protein
MRSKEEDVDAVVREKRENDYQSTKNTPYRQQKVMVSNE